MSWEAIIDQMKEWVDAQGYLPPSYVNRRNFNNYDFTTLDFTVDSAWHELDLSAIVPAEAQAVSLHVRGTSDTVGSVVFFRADGYTESVGTCRIRPQVANVSVALVFVMGFPNTKKIEYRVWTGVWAHLSLKVIGWWL